MSELSPEAKALLAALAPSHDPPPDAAARVRAAVAARVAAPPVPRRWPWIAGVGVAAVLAAVALSRRAPEAPPPPPPAVRVAPPALPPPPAPAPPAAVVANDVPAAQEPVIAVRRPRRADPPADDLAGELLLIQRAQRALARGDGAEALDAVDAHARAYPRGRLTEERDAARVLALCALGRADASRAAAARFIARHPDSPQAARVRGACAR